MINKKLLEFQKLGITIKKGERNPHFKNTYANLNEVLDKVTKPLNDLGIVIIQTPERDGLLTTLHDTEDETYIQGFLPFIGATNPQQIGSNLTYYRRYSLVTMLGLEDEDDDGNKASSGFTAKVQSKTEDLSEQSNDISFD
jgi:hypothetical protein